MKKSLVLLLSLLLLVTVFLNGCQQSVDTPAPTGEPQVSADPNVADENVVKPPVAGQATTLPLAEPGSVTITIATNDNNYAPASYNDGLEVWKEIEERTGVKVEWELSPANEINTVMGVRLAAASELPDLFYVPQSNPIPYARDGVILDMTDLLNDHAPYTTAFLSDNPEVKKEMTAPDGKIYHIPNVISGTDSGDPVGWIVRQDWLDKLGLDMPESIDDWYEVWTAFKKGDPNETGQEDVIPLTVRGLGELGRLGDAWGLHLYWFSNGFYPDENGQVQYDWIDPRAKEFVAFANKLFEEGLLDPEFLTQTSEDRLGKISRNLVGTVDRFINNLPAFESAAREGGAVDVNYTVASPPSGPNGYPGHQERYGVTGGAFSFSKDVEHPEIFMRWLDWVFASPEGNMLATFGIEGKSYEMVSGEPVFSEWVTDNPDGLGFADALRSLGAQPNLPWIRSDKGPFSKQPFASIQHSPKLIDAVERIEPFLIPSMPKIMMSSDEATELQSFMSDIDTYRDETIAQFIFGQKDMDEWDDYVSRMKDLGVEKVLEIRQTMYDRSLE